MQAKNIYVDDDLDKRLAVTNIVIFMFAFSIPLLYQFDGFNDGFNDLTSSLPYL